VKDALIDQKKNIQAYLSDTIKDKMIGNEAAIAIAFSGDAMFCQDENEEIDYAIPKEGTNIWHDAMIIPKGARNKEGAEKFINFLCRPDMAAKNVEYIGYSTVNVKAVEYLDEELVANHIFWPDEEELAPCETFHDLGPEAKRMYDKLWMEILIKKPE
jgi:spermidine/putrescine-binding protein